MFVNVLRENRWALDAKTVRASSKGQYLGFDFSDIITNNIWVSMNAMTQMTIFCKD
jgi:hypothetical protein